MFDISPIAHAPRRSLYAVACAVALLGLSGPAVADDGSRHGAVDQRFEALVFAVQRLRSAPAHTRAREVRILVDRAVDVEAWLGDAVPDREQLPPADRRALVERTRRLLVARAVRHLAVEGEARIELEKTRVDGRGVAVDCLVHTDDAIYEIALRWSGGHAPRLRDVMVEGVSVGAADRRRVRRAWDVGGLPEALAALDRAIARLGFSGPPAIATQTRSADRPPAPERRPLSARPPGL